MDSPPSQIGAPGMATRDPSPAPLRLFPRQVAPLKPKVHASARIVIAGISCHLEYVEPGSPPPMKPGTVAGKEVAGGGEFRIVPD